MTATSQLGRNSPVLAQDISPTQARKEQRKSMLNDNWYVLDDEQDENQMPPVSPSRQPAVLPKVHVTDDDISFVHQPLRMNPPTPTPEKQRQPQSNDRNALTEVSINRSLTVASDNTVTSSVYSESAPSLKSNKVRTTPKSKYYGDLAAATRGVRGYAQLPQAEELYAERSPSPGKQQTRVLSRTGADIADESMMFIPEKNSRRRMVSGKTAEEGLGGYW